VLAAKKTDGLLENLRILKLIFVTNSVKRHVKFHEATLIVKQLYGVPHGILKVFNTILYENEFQNPQIFQQTISLFPEQSILEIWVNLKKNQCQVPESEQDD
jgi:hypothetical protein